ncbi:cytochrome P450 [Solwaraspora sp. WMMD406]|uniref:cytochrome P450 n=1 Tax=Solwaraspora sp. WMMD406 TaxID=3016095 RepID=UPI003242BFB2
MSAWRILPSLVRDPLATLVRLADHADGRVVRLGLGPVRPYLITDPAHVAHVVRDNSGNYLRDGRGLLWQPIKRLFGDGVLSEGPVWESSRRTLQPLFTARRVDALTEDLADAIDAAMEPLAEAAYAGRTVDMGRELSRIVCRAVVRVLFADRFSVTDALRITAAQDTIATAVLPRLLLSFVPNSVPVPGDRAFRDAVRTIDGIVLPVVRQVMAQPADGGDVLATLVRGVDAHGRPLDETQIRNDTVAMFATSTETTYGVLTWLWPILQAHPEVAARLYDEVDEVVGAGPVRGHHLTRLRYTRMVLDELLRLYPVAWLMPRTAVAADTIGGVGVEAGAHLLLSPYLTQRLSGVWPDPERFDPERFDPERTDPERTDQRPADTDPAGGCPAGSGPLTSRPVRRPRYAHFPFGGGPHQCLGQHLFYLEGLLIVASIVSRFRISVPDGRVPRPRAGASLRTSHPVQVTLRPVAPTRMD